MSDREATVRIIADTTDVTAKTMIVQQQANNLQRSVASSGVRAITYFHYAMHLSNIIAGQLARIYEGTTSAAAIQATIEGIQIASSEVNIGMTTARGIAALSNPATIAQGIMLLSIAASMQYMVVEQQILKAQADQAAQEGEAAKNFFNQYT